MNPTAFVLDASVLVAAALPNEPFHADARKLVQRLIAEHASLLLPTIARVEVAAAIARGVSDTQLAQQVALGYSTHPDSQHIAVDGVLCDYAIEVAVNQRIRGCDAVYVALAFVEQAVLITLDAQQRTRAPANVLARTPAQALAEWFR